MFFEAHCSDSDPELHMPTSSGKYIVFHENTLCVRGSTRAVFDYASNSKEYLGLDPIIVYNKDNKDNDQQVINMFREKFVHLYSYEDGQIDTIMEKICKKYAVEFVYIIKAGHRDGIETNLARCGIHVMFGVLEPHGDIYAYVSQQEAKSASYGYLPFVPHIVDLPNVKESMRPDLGIPEDAFVFGRHGGSETFDIEFVKDEIMKLVEERDDVYFLFVNTNPFAEHDQIIFHEKIVEPDTKAAFIMSCDAMIHARSRGESFGLSICEFLSLDKPVLCWSGGYDRNHIYLLRNDPECLYDDAESLRLAIGRLISSRKPKGYYKSIVADYNPRVVMPMFRHVFLDSPSRKSLLGYLIERRKLLELWSRHKFYRFRLRMRSLVQLTRP